jgi:hypothetical protein
MLIEMRRRRLIMVLDLRLALIERVLRVWFVLRMWLGWEEGSFWLCQS